MTETEWLTSTDPAAMLRCLTGSAQGHTYIPSNRKLRLFAVACCRQAPVTTGQWAIEIAERYADGKASVGQLDVSRRGKSCWPLDWEHSITDRNAALTGEIAELMIGYGGTKDGQAALLREIFGNPFRPIEVHYQDAIVGGVFSSEKRIQVWRTRWLTPTVLRIAEAAYEERLGDGVYKTCMGDGCPYCGGPEVDYHESCIRCPDCHGTGRTNTSGQLDPARLAILADALEDAGCVGEEIEFCACGERMTSAHYQLTEGKCGPPYTEFLLHPIIEHLRSPGPHYRGCWAVDLVLGKE